MALDSQTLMVATDFSEASEAALAYAFRLARTLNARLDIVHVVPEDDVQLLAALSNHLQSHITAETLREMLYADADKRLAAMVGQANASELIQERLIVTGRPAEAIISWATSKQPMCLFSEPIAVAGSIYPLLGSVAERVLRQAPCAVLIVPAKSTK